MMEVRPIRLPNGIELAVADQGPRDAPALIFLHGFPENHRSWRHQIAHLADRYRCIAPEQRGYHRSSRPQDVASYTPDKLIGDIFLLADALDLAEFTIVGHDWGGAIAWGVAITGQMTGRVTRLVIANSPHPTIFPRLLWTSPAQRGASQYFRTFRDSANDELVRQFGLGGMLAKAFGDRIHKGEEAELAIQMQDWLDRDAAFGMLNWYRASPMVVPPMDAPFALPKDYVDLPLPPIAVPTLVIWAMNDFALPAENLDGLDKLVTDLTLVKVPDCGHFVQWEQPAVVNATLDAFLARTDRHG